MSRAVGWQEARGETGLGIAWQSSSWDSTLPTEEAQGSIPGQGTGSHMWILIRVHMPQLKILHAARKPRQPKKLINTTGLHRRAAGPLPSRVPAVQGQPSRREMHQTPVLASPLPWPQRHGSRVLLSLSLTCTLTPLYTAHWPLLHGLTLLCIICERPRRPGGRKPDLKMFTLWNQCFISELSKWNTQIQASQNHTCRPSPFSAVTSLGQGRPQIYQRVQATGMSFTD